MKKMQLVMVGNGMAGVRTLEELLKIAPDLYEITIFGAEPHPNYNRILLSPVLAGEQTLEQIVLNDWAWYAEHGITLHAGCTVTEVNRARRTVQAVRGTGETISVPYDRLILATGSNPFMLPIPGKDLDGVLAYRDIADTQAMIDAAAQYRHAVVIGGGLLGLEAANGLMKRGMQVTVVHAGEWLLDRQLDPTAGQMLQKALQERGMAFLMQAQTEAGVVRLLAVDYRVRDAEESSELRGYVQFDAERLAELGPEPTLFGLFGKGYLAITFEHPAPGTSEVIRYQGIVPLEGQSLSDAAQHYFEQSEQLPTFIRVAVGHENGKGHVAAHCLL